MGSKSDYLENKILDHVLKNTAYTSPAAVYMGLFTATPSDAGGGTEVSGFNYGRTAITFGSAASGSSTNSADVVFPTPSGSWGAVTSFGVFDAATNGNLLYWGALSQTESPISGNIVKFLAGAITITED